MLWLKSLHIVFMVTWFAGLFYLPRLFVYHALAEDAVSRARFKVMERKLFWGMLTNKGMEGIVGSAIMQDRDHKSRAPHYQPSQQSRVLKGPCSGDGWQSIAT